MTGIAETALLCMALNVYFEARSEPMAGQVAVANVTMNRANGDPAQVCPVVTAPKQFSWTIDKLERVRSKNGRVNYRLRKGQAPKDMVAWTKAVMVSELAIANALPDVTHGSQFYHATYVNPNWNNKQRVVKTIGKHMFYKTAAKAKY